MHELYRRNELEKGVTLEENSSLLQWGELPEEKKAANRDFARRAASVLNDVGAELAPLSRRETGDLLLDESQIERMAIAEHDGWVADRERRGWKYGPVRDEEKKEHPTMIPWDELDRQNQEKDFDSVRGLAGMLASIGYELVIEPKPEEGLGSAAPRPVE